MSLDNSELEHLMDILEELDDQKMAAGLLKEFNELSKTHSKLLFNQDSSLDHEEWKKKCDSSKLKLDNLINKIMSLKGN